MNFVDILWEGFFASNCQCDSSICKFRMYIHSYNPIVSMATTNSANAPAAAAPSSAIKEW